MFEIKLNKVYEVLDEKDCIIAGLKASLQKIQESLEKSSLGKESEMINIHDKAEAPISKFRCSSFDYQARSSHGLKSHICRKRLISFVKNDFVIWLTVPNERSCLTLQLQGFLTCTNKQSNADYC